MRPVALADYAWRGDPSVPAWDEARILLVMDGDCALCSAAARRIALWDGADKIRITTAEGPLGRALLRLYGLDADDPATWLMIEDGRAYGSLDAMLRLAPRLKRWTRVFGALRVLPVAVQDWLYARIARNRYALFGRDDLCALPPEALRRRLVG
ncbi:MAG: DCC1-like thiol-disulfide oxidoreductase family protein [Pseudomonadota bacterium]